MMMPMHHLWRGPANLKHESETDLINLALDAEPAPCYKQARLPMTQHEQKSTLILTIIGGLNWGSIGLFKFDIVAWLFGSQEALLSRIVYTVIALAGVWCISLLFRERETGEITGDMMR